MLFISENPRAWCGQMKAALATLGCTPQEYFKRGEAWAREQNCFRPAENSDNHFSLYRDSLQKRGEPYFPEHMRRFTSDMLNLNAAERPLLMSFPARDAKQQRGVSRVAAQVVVNSRKTPRYVNQSAGRR